MTEQDLPKETNTSESQEKPGTEVLPPNGNHLEPTQEVPFVAGPTPETHPELFPDPNWNEREHRPLYDKQIKGQKVYLVEIPFLSPPEQAEIAVQNRKRLIEKCEKLGAEVINKEPVDEWWQPIPGRELMKKEGEAFSKIVTEIMDCDIIIFGDSYYKTRFALEISNTINKTMKTVLREVELDDLIYINEH